MEQDSRFPPLSPKLGATNAGIFHFRAYNENEEFLLIMATNPSLLFLSAKGKPGMPFGLKQRLQPA